MQRGKRTTALFLVMAMLVTMLPETFYAASMADGSAKTAESVESMEDMEGTEYVENMGNAESAEYVESTGDTESAEDTGSAEDAESAERTDNAEDADNAESTATERVENAEGTAGMGPGDVVPEAGMRIQPGDGAGTEPAEEETETAVEKAEAARFASGAEAKTAEEDAGEEEIDAVGTAVDEYTFLTVGDPLSRTGAVSSEQFAFRPDASGWYHVKVESNTGMAVNAARVYIENDEEKTVGFWSWSPYCREIEDHVFYCQAGDTYLFDVGPGGGEAADYIISVNTGEVSQIEVAAKPESSYDTINYDGMKLKLVYSDGTSTITDVDTYGRIEAFFNASLDSSNHFEPYIGIEYYGDAENPVYDVSGLVDGTHTVHAYIWKYLSGNPMQSAFTFDIVVERDAVESLEVISKEKETYEAGFRENLNSRESDIKNKVAVRVNYKDGRDAKEISSKTDNTGLYQYLEINDQRYETVEEYLANGGNLGQATVHVSYRGVETTYEITIVENPYSSMEVELYDTQYYAGCRYEFANSFYPGDDLYPGEVIKQVTLHYKDTSEEEVFDSWYSLPDNWRRTEAGLKFTADGETRLYQYVDDYIAAGGALGEAVYEVNYAGVIAEIPVEVCANPYSKIEIITPPGRTTYIEGNSYGISTAGMVIRAYHADSETEYTDITVPNGTSTVGERRIIRHLSTRLGGHEDTRYLEPGAHDVTVFYYGHSATYTIEVVDSLISDFAITKEPEYTKFLVDNPNGNWIDTQGMELSFTLNGENYENFQIGSPEYYQLCEQYSEWVYEDSSKVNLKKTGTYPVKISFMGATAEYQVQVLDKIVDSMTILTPPFRTTYFAGEMKSVDINGLELSVTGLDGVVTKYRAYGGEGDGYGSWSDIDNWRNGYQLDTSSVNFNEPGTYEAVLHSGGVSDTFVIEIVESPVASLEINQMPEKMSYFQFEAWNIDLKGLQYTIHFNEGTPDYSGTVEYSGSGIGIEYQSQTYYMGSEWKNQDFYNDAALEENSIRLSFLGITAEIPASMQEDPISKIEAVRNPERMQYCPFQNLTADLYGAEFRIYYKDGTTETVSVQEHVSGIVTEKYGLVLQGDIVDNGSMLNVSITGRDVCSILLEKFDFSKEAYTDTADDKLQNVTATPAEPYKIFRFIPTETKEYTFFSEGSYDSYGYIYQEDTSLLISNDDRGTDSNFSMTAVLTAGETYYCVARMYHAEVEGSFISCISSKRSSFTLQADNIEKFEVLKAPKTQYYTFEKDIWSGDVPMNGLEYRITCKDGLTFDGKVDSNSKTWNEMDSDGNMVVYADILGAYLSGRFQHVANDRLDMTKENAIIYSIGTCQAEVPITVDETSPVASITLEKNPWSQVMQYNAYEAFYKRDGLELTVHYTDGTERTVQNGSEWVDDGYHAYMSFEWKNYNENGGVAEGDNAIIITYMGISVEAPILVKENAVKQLAVKENPEKMTYLPFENQVDLYGLGLEVVYEDGESETFKITEHGSSVDVKTIYGMGTIEASFVEKEDDGSQMVNVTFMNSSVYYYPTIQSSYAELLQNASEIEINQTISVSLDSRNLYQIYRFTPSVSMNYAFSSAGDADTYVYLLDQYGEVLDSDDDGKDEEGNFKLNNRLESGITYYYLVRMLGVGKDGSFTCILNSGETETEIAEAGITMDIPTAGEELPAAAALEGCSVSVSWTNAGNETTAEYAKAYRAKILLVPEDGYVFAAGAAISLNGKNVVSKTYNSNGTITVYYTFPYTNCKITVPEIEGYTLDESTNSIQGQTEYGGSYSFRYQKTAERAEAIVVSADGRLLKADENGMYTMTGIKSEVSVTVKMISEETRKDWTRLNFYNKEILSDSFYTERNSTVSVSGEEHVLPVLESYVDGSDQFFFGWYQNQDDSLNGIGARFRSTTTVPDQDILPLYAKWGIGIFSYIYNAKTVNYRILSIDEDNRLKVQVGDASNAAVRRRDAEAVDAVGNDDIVIIPANITDLSGTGLDELGIDFNGCEVTSIAENAFSGDTGIRKISLPDTITEIGAGAFSGCTKLERIEIPGSVAKIESGTFSGCEKLTDVVLAEGVSSIGVEAFEGCSSLKTVVVPDSVEDIDATAFSNSAENLTIICSSNLTDIVTEAAEAAGAAVQTVDITLDYTYADKEFTYGDKAFTITAKVLVDGREDEKRTAALSWKAAAGTTDFYTMEQAANTVTVTPGDVTDGTSCSITVTDSVSSQSKSIVLLTKAVPFTHIAAVDEIAAVTYTGSPVQPKVTVRLTNGTQLVENKDYTVAYLDNTEAGSQAMVKVTGIHNYCGELTRYFTIQKKEDEAPKGEAGSKEKADGVELDKRELRIKPKSSQKLTAKITPAGITSAVVWTSSNPAVASVSSDGTVKAVSGGTSRITATVDGKTAVCQIVVPYTITYKLNGGKNNAANPADYFKEKVTLKNPTRAKYIFAGWYTDKKFKKKITKIKADAEKNYVLYAKWTKISLGTPKVSSAKKSSSSTKVTYKKTSKKSKTRKIEVKFRKVSRADGYEIAYSTNKKFKKSATNTTTVKKNKVTVKLKKGKTYYIRIRAYQMDSTGKKVYGKWTSSKKVDVKK